MNAVQRWQRYSAREWVLLAGAFAALCGARAALAVLPWRVIEPREAKNPAKSAGKRRAEVSELSISVARAARIVPRSYCLAQALALHWLSLAVGVPVRVVIGASRADGNRIRAHAWVEHEGRIVHGGSEDVGSFQRFARPAAKRSRH